ncbi:MAG: oligopeptide ABC transporter permease OppB [Treponemataceae bacterium]|nr:oligopeptide ABC transporter permease OppB [Treponemataceae bacterium]
MLRFIIRRLLSIIPTMFIIVTLSFFLIRFAPGGPFSSEKKIPEQVLQNILKKYHMDWPLYKQYGKYLYDLLHGDLGPSFRYQDQTVNELVAATMPVSIVLGTLSLGLAVVLGLLTGIISALRQNRLPDYIAMSFAVIGITVPLFVIGPVLQLVFAMQLNWLPASGWINTRAGWKTVLLPMITLAFPYFAYIARLSRGSILEVLRSDYIRTARAKGLSEPVVVFKHVLKGALLPVVSYLGPAFSGIITGSVVVEQVFKVPGVGQIFIQSALNRDYTLIMGDIIIYSLILVIMNFVVDIVYGLLDPRIAYK